MIICLSCLPADVELQRQKRVIGGEQYTKGEFPFHASLWYMAKNNPYTALTPDLHHTCGGILIKKMWVLTAGACFDDDLLPGLGDLSQWKVYLGMYAQTDAEDEAQMRTIDQVFFPPEYNFNRSSGDIALLKLNKKVKITDTVDVAKLNRKWWCPHDDSDAMVIGWGQTQNETYGLGSDVPHKANVKVVSTKICKEKYYDPELQPIFGDLLLDKTNICAGLPEGGVDACYGDSGSPILSSCGKEGKLFVVGTTSYGYGCAKPDFPAVYTRISHYYDWIMDTSFNN